MRGPRGDRCLGTAYTDTLTVNLDSPCSVDGSDRCPGTVVQVCGDRCPGDKVPSVSPLLAISLDANVGLRSAGSWQGLAYSDF